MIDESNPAGRLHKILSAAKKQPAQKTVKEVWAEVLSIEPEDIIVTKNVVALYSLSQEIQSLIKMNENLNHELYLLSFHKIDKAFFPLHLATSWKGAQQHLTEEAITRLQFCAEELSGFYSEETLSEEDLNDIIGKTEELFNALYSSSIPDALRLTLLEEVERIRNAINMFKIKGAKGLKEALQGTIGAVIANQDELKTIAQTDDDVIKRLGELIDKMDSFASRALKIKKALSSPIRFVLEKLTEPDSDCEEDSIEKET